MISNKKNFSFFTAAICGWKVLVWVTFNNIQAELLFNFARAQIVAEAQSLGFEKGWDVRILGARRKIVLA